MRRTSVVAWGWGMICEAGVGLCLICLRGCGLGRLEGKEYFPGEPHRPECKAEGAACSEAWGPDQPGGSQVVELVEPGKVRGCSVRIPLNLYGLHSSLEMTGTTPRTLV